MRASFLRPVAFPPVVFPLAPSDVLLGAWNVRANQSNGNPRIRILLLAKDDCNLLHLQHLLDPAGKFFQLDLLPPGPDLKPRLEGRDYAAVLCDCDSLDGDSREWVRSQKDNLPVIFLEAGIDEAALRGQIQSTLCNLRRGCSAQSSCSALDLLGLVNRYQSEKLHHDTEQMLNKLRHTVEQSPDPVMIADRSGVLEYVNPAFEALTGYSREEVTGQTLGILKSEQQPGELYEEMWDTVLSGRVFHGTVMNRKKNGESFLLEKSITPLRNTAGQITHFISTGRDVTNQRRLEAQLQQAQKMDAVGRLAGGVAHDFNNLLMVISAYAELMLDHLDPAHPARQNANEIITAARRAADLTRQLLGFSRKQVQALQVLDPNFVVGEIVRMLPRLLGEDIRLTFHPDPAIGKVKADPVQIEQIVMNLAANARDAMPQGGALTIETQNVNLTSADLEHQPVANPGAYIVLTITDSGIGIPLEQQAHIFEPFYTTKAEGRGTGLGLATVYGIVQQNGGFITLQSEVGSGTVFKIHLPRVTAAACRVEDSAKSLGNCPRGHETVLLVEDEGSVREATRQFLTNAGYTVLDAGTGEDALSASRQYAGPIHILVSDVVLPSLSGPALAAQLCAERPRLKKLFVSGYAEATILRHGEIDVAAHFLQKPFELRSLAWKVREILDTTAPRAQSATCSV